METRASYVLIGAFTVLGILAGLAFFIWLAKVQLDKTYSHYDILFDTVAGLALASPVQFNGVDVGKVTAIDLDRDDPGRVRVRIEVVSATPVRQGTEATLQAQGVTGVSVVSLAGGAPDADRLPIVSPNDVPMIPSKPSAVQDLLQGAPDLLAEAIALLKDIQAFTTPENRIAIASILQNVDAATANLNTAIGDFSEVSVDIGAAVDQITTFTTRLDSFGDQADQVMTTAVRTMDGIDGLSGEVTPRIATLASEVSRLIGDLTDLTSRIERDPAQFLLGSQTPEYTR
jgi:phospholipid/cholesterol/gamma-HCH transport system substrate-binding protein